MADDRVDNNASVEVPARAAEHSRIPSSGVAVSRYGFRDEVLWSRVCQNSGYETGNYVDLYRESGDD